MNAEQGQRMGAIVPTCEDMCPELERYAREVNEELDKLECNQQLLLQTGRSGKCATALGARIDEYCPLFLVCDKQILSSVSSV